uniref:Uncharacterized protein n=1 Tax=Tolypiocladia glomerulata TaxID=860646 RepID=A0A1Z1MUQ4_9FLOR|nr:hypothetical protein [Tolypiocladia glomerulata]ARW69837.1 hypothetical protein [Tolypiocladia glomerulata]
MKREILLKKLDLLHISLEVILTSRKDIICNEEFRRLQICLKNKEYNQKQNFVVLIEYIYHLKKFVINKYIDQLACSITKDDKILEQYILKFYYNYFKNKKYYINYKSFVVKHKQKITIENNAIVTLKIISQLNKDNGVYNLIQYLKK